MAPPSLKRNFYVSLKEGQTKLKLGRLFLEEEVSFPYANLHGGSNCLEISLILQSSWGTGSSGEMEIKIFNTDKVNVVHYRKTCCDRYAE